MCVCIHAPTYVQGCAWMSVGGWYQISTSIAPPHFIFWGRVSSLNLEITVSTTQVGGRDLPVPTTPSAGFRDTPPYLLCVGSGDLNAGSSASGWTFTHRGISPAPLTCIEQQRYWGMPSESATLQNSCSVRNLRTNSSNLNQDSCFWNNNLCVSKLERTRYLWDTMSVILKINKYYTINSIL